MNGFFNDADLSEFEEQVKKPIGEPNDQKEENLPPPVRAVNTTIYTQRMEESLQGRHSKKTEMEEKTTETKEKKMENVTKTKQDIKKDALEQTIEKSSPVSFVKENKNTEALLGEQYATNIAIGTEIEGNISTNGTLSVDGHIKGDTHAGQNLTILRHGVVNGKASSDGKVHVRGKVLGGISGAEIILEKTVVKGEVYSSGPLTIGTDAVVIGPVSAVDVSIAGAVNGNIDAKGHVILEATAIVKGDIRSKSVQVSAGAAVDGICTQCYADVNPTSFFEKFENSEE